MARKENIYVVDKSTQAIVRVSKTFLAACQFFDYKTMFICTSEFQTLKKGDTISDITAILED